MEGITPNQSYQALHLSSQSDTLNATWSEIIVD